MPASSIACLPLYPTAIQDLSRRLSTGWVFTGDWRPDMRLIKCAHREAAVQRVEAGWVEDLADQSHDHDHFDAAGQQLPCGPRAEGVPFIKA